MLGTLLIYDIFLISDLLTSKLLSINTLFSFLFFLEDDTKSWFIHSLIFKISRSNGTRLIIQRQNNTSTFSSLRTKPRKTVVIMQQYDHDPNLWRNHIRGESCSEKSCNVNGLPAEFFSPRGEKRVYNTAGQRPTP